MCSAPPATQAYSRRATARHKLQNFSGSIADWDEVLKRNSANLEARKGKKEAEQVGAT